MKGRKKDGTFLPGNVVGMKHGLYSKKLPVPGKREIQRHLDGLQKELEEAFPEGTPQQRLLISQIVRAEGIQRIIEVYFKQAGLLDPGKYRRGKLEAQPVVNTYFRAMKEQRAAVGALGLDKPPEPPISVTDYIKAFDERKKHKRKTHEIDSEGRSEQG